MNRPPWVAAAVTPIVLARLAMTARSSRSASVKPELAAEIKNLAEREQTSVAALVEEATINLLKARGIEYPDYLRHYRKLA